MLERRFITLRSLDFNQQQIFMNLWLCTVNPGMSIEDDLQAKGIVKSHVIALTDDHESIC